MSTGRQHGDIATVASLLVAAILYLCLEAQPLQAKGRSERPSAQGVASAAIPRSCTQREVIGNDDFGPALENVCRHFERNSFDVNMAEILRVMHDPKTGIGSAPYDRQRMRYLILCGDNPSRTTVAGGGQVHCEKMAARIGISDARTIPEWSIYQSVVKPLGAHTRDMEELDRGYIHMLSAKDVMRYKLERLSGCTGAARVFAVFARSLGIPARHVVTFRVDDYRKACSCISGSCVGHRRDQETIINGHQVVAVQIPETGKWRLLNSSAKPTKPFWGFDYDSHQVLEVSDPMEFVGRSVDFGMKGDGSATPHHYFVSIVENGEAPDNLWLDRLGRLFNLSVSGKPDDPTCRFEPPGD